MKRKPLLVSLLVVAIGGGLAFLVLKPEPHYCWLVFGPQARLRLLVCLKGNNVFIDRDGDGEFSGDGEQLGSLDKLRDLVLADPDKQATYTVTRMNRYEDPGPPRRASLMANVLIKGSLEYSQYCGVDLTSSSSDAKEAHFHGPLVVEPVKANWKLPPDLALFRGDKPVSLRVTTGTMNAERGCWVVVRTQGKDSQPTFPKGVHPVVDVEFPPKSPGTAPIRRRYPLDEPC